MSPATKTAQSKWKAIGSSSSDSISAPLVAANKGQVRASAGHNSPTVSESADAIPSGQQNTSKNTPSTSGEKQGSKYTTSEIIASGEETVTDSPAIAESARSPDQKTPDEAENAPLASEENDSG